MFGLTIKQINPVYDRFNHLYDKFKNRVFRTALGDRKVSITKIGSSLYFSYHDKDGSELFLIEVTNKNGIEQVYRKDIDDIAIYSAIYEIETILFKEQNMEHDKAVNLATLLRWY